MRLLSRFILKKISMTATSSISSGTGLFLVRIPLFVVGHPCNNKREGPCSHPCTSFSRMRSRIRHIYQSEVKFSLKFENKLREEMERSSVQSPKNNEQRIMDDFFENLNFFVVVSGLFPSCLVFAPHK